MTDPSSHDDAARDPGMPVALYRGPQLRWFRGGALVALVACSVAMGALLHAGWPAFVAWWFPAPVAGPALAPLAQMGSDGRVLKGGVLRGPAAVLTLPPAETTVVNVWLENCSDCMPAFNAWARFAESSLGAATGAPNAEMRLKSNVPVVNVAYGQATAAFAVRYHVDSGLVFDGGSAVVQPLGIGTFTTLLLDKAGRVRLVDAPQNAGFAERLAGAIAAVNAGP